MIKMFKMTASSVRRDDINHMRANMESRDIINLSTLAESKKKKRGCDPFSSFLHLFPPFILRCILLPTRGIIICKSNSSVTAIKPQF